MTPEVIVVANRKGGTAKTTTVVNLAHQLAVQQQRVLILDLDNQGHIEFGFGHKLSPVPQSRWLDTTPIFRGLFRFNAWIDLALADIRLGEQEQCVKLHSFCHLLEQPAIQQHYDAVLIDTPPTLGPVLLAALAAANRIVIPAEPTPLASDGVNKLLNACTRAIQGRRFKASRVEILPVMVDKHLTLHRQTLGQWEGRFGHDRVLPAIRRNIKLAEAFSHQQPVAEYAPRCAGAQDYKVLCKTLFTHQR